MKLHLRNSQEISRHRARMGSIWVHSYKETQISKAHNKDRDWLYK
jgi:hypothetical protein